MHYRRLDNDKASLAFTLCDNCMIVNIKNITNAVAGRTTIANIANTWIQYVLFQA